MFALRAFSLVFLLKKGGLLAAAQIAIWMDELVSYLLLLSNFLMDGYQSHIKLSTS